MRFTIKALNTETTIDVVSKEVKQWIEWLAMEYCYPNEAKEFDQEDVARAIEHARGVEVLMEDHMLGHIKNYAKCEDMVFAAQKARLAMKTNGAEVYCLFN